MNRYFQTPPVVKNLIIINALFFLAEVILPNGLGDLLIDKLGLYPWQSPNFRLYQLITHMFLHGGWGHFLVNMWTLWIFGDNIEDVMGPVRFTIFYLTCGLAALLTHMVFSASSTVPVVGASGAIAGVLGAYFLLYPHARVTTLVPLLFIPLIFDLPAVVYLGIWFVTQLLSGLTTLGSNGAGIAWWAHLGGFVAGFVLLPLFRQKGRCYYCRFPEGRGRGVIRAPHDPEA